MSPRFEPDLTKTRASTRIFDRGEYELEITGLRPVQFGGDNYIYTRESDGEVVAGVATTFKMVGRVQPDGSLDREFEGEDVSSDRHYIHTEGSYPFTKRFLMAAAGFSREEEDAFDEEWASDNPIFIDGEPDDPDSQELGPGWEAIVGLHVVASLDQRMSEEEGDDRVFQEFRSYQPVD